MNHSCEIPKNGTLHLIIDSDNLFFDYRSVLVNFLGSISNSLENSLKSPWNYKLEESCCKNSSHADCNNHVNNSLNGTSPNADSHLLRHTINSLLDSSVLPPELIEKSLSVLNAVLNGHSKSQNLKLKSFCETFSNSSLFYVSVKDGKAFKHRFKVLENLDLSDIPSFLLDVLLLGTHSNDSLNLLNKKDHNHHPNNHSHNHVDCLQLFENYKFVFLTSFPEATKDFLTTQGFLPKRTKDCTIIKRLENLPKKELENVSNSFQILSTNPQFVKSVSDYFSTNFSKSGSVIKCHMSPQPKESPSKVDLDSSFDLKSLSGTIGAFLQFKKPLELSGKVFSGHRRGFSLLGIPTANINPSNLPHLLTGVYLGHAFLTGNSEVSENTKLDTIVSIGFNPHFFGENNSVEAYIYHKFSDQFYGQHLRLSLYGYLRTDSKFESLEVLVKIIQSDLHLHKLIISSLDS